MTDATGVRPRNKFWIAKPYEQLSPLRRPKTDRRRPSPADIQRILNMRKAGHTKDKIVASVGFSTWTIDKVCSQHLSDYERAEIRSAVQRSKAGYENCPARVKRQEILDLRRQGLTIISIARQLNLCDASVKRICKELDWIEEEIAAQNAARAKFQLGFDHRRARRAGGRP